MGTVVSGSAVVGKCDDDIRDLVTIVLEGLGLSVIAVGNGAEALAECRRLKPRLLLVDVALPVMDGLEVCRAVRADPDLAALAVVLMTARAHPGDVQAVMDAGADRYVIKPFGPIELRDLFEGDLE